MNTDSNSCIIQRDVDLTEANTLRLASSAAARITIKSIDDLQTAFRFHRIEKLPLRPLGDGSNVILSSFVNACILDIDFKGIEVVNEDYNNIWVKVGAGENWHEFVLHTIEKGWGGIENLSLIPGCVGASPMQNIGAYGVEIIDVLNYVDAINISTGDHRRFTVEECELGYRESIFKGSEKGKWAIVRVGYKLDRESELKMSYGAIEEELKDIHHDARTHKHVSDAVIRIRQSKLPDPNVLGNAGSFFKNPVVSQEEFNKISVEGMPSYPQTDGRVKLAAGWLIDQTGWKGHDRGTHGVHEMQALVLVNKGGATGTEIWALAEDIIASVKEKFGIVLQPEVNQIR